MNIVLTALGKMLGFGSVFAFFSISLILIYKNFTSYIANKENSKTNNIDILITWLNEHGSPKDRFITEQLFQKRFGSLIDYQIIEYLLKKTNPSSHILKYKNARPYVFFDDISNIFMLKNKWSKTRLVKGERLMIFLFFIFMISSLGFTFMLVLSYTIDAYFIDIIMFSLLGFGFLLLAGITIEESLAMKSARELVES